MNMKKYLLLITAAILMACATLTPAERQELAKKVNAALDDRHYTIDIRTMSPRRGPMKTVTSDWSLEVKGNTLVSYLPYIGRAFTVPYGGGMGLNFTAPISEYHEKKGSKNARQITILVSNNEDTYTYIIEVFDNGSSSIDVQARNREGISYSGDMSFPSL